MLSREVGGKKRVAVVFVVDGSARDKEVGSVVECVLSHPSLFSFFLARSLSLFRSVTGADLIGF